MRFIKGVKWENVTGNCQKEAIVSILSTVTSRLVGGNLPEDAEEYSSSPGMMATMSSRVEYRRMYSPMLVTADNIDDTNEKPAKKKAHW